MPSRIKEKEILLIEKQMILDVCIIEEKKEIINTIETTGCPSGCMKSSIVRWTLFQSQKADGLKEGNSQELGKIKPMQN